MCHDWPKPPIWPEDLPLIRELLTDEEYAELLRRMVQVLPKISPPQFGHGVPAGHSSSGYDVVARPRTNGTNHPRSSSLRNA